MIPIVSVPVAAPSVVTPPASKAALPQQVQAPRSSAGELSAANLRPATPQAIDAAKQSAVAARLRDQETSDRGSPDAPDQNAPAGPTPTFAETILARQIRVALDPPALAPPPAPTPQDFTLPKVIAQKEVDLPQEETRSTLGEPALRSSTAVINKSTVTGQAESSFAETRALETLPEPALIDIRG